MNTDWLYTTPHMWNGDFDQTVRAEWQLVYLSSVVRILIEEFLKKRTVRGVQGAYEAGLALGFYGKRSAVGVGARMKFVAELHEIRKDKDARVRGNITALLVIQRIGREHGRLVLGATESIFVPAS